MQEFESIATGREHSLFTPDIVAHKAELQDLIKGARIAIIGAAGSIGSAVVKQILKHSPASLVLFDLSENNLVEVVRDLRSATGVSIPRDFATLPIGLGSPEFSRYFRESPHFQYVFNLSAIKHVRSEKDVYCLTRMIDTNILFPHTFLEGLDYPLTRFFSVSSDKATHPANLMGASKMVMEEVLSFHSSRHPTSSARFANVAFSDGSLPWGFLKRLEKEQPLSVPRDVKRFFISHEEAGELCLLAGFLGENRDVLFPKLDKIPAPTSFVEIATGLLKRRGYRPVECASEEEAKAGGHRMIPKGEWPCFFFDSDTTGEKITEEFFAPQDELDLDRFLAVGTIKRRNASRYSEVLQTFLAFAKRLSQNDGITKSEIVEAFKKVVPGLCHVEKGLNLDQKM